MTEKLQIPKGLSSEVGDQAKKFYITHRSHVRNIDKLEKELKEIPPLEKIDTKNWYQRSSRVNKEQQFDSELVNKDANLWQAHEHKNEHLPEYIEQAKQDAEAAGHEIHLKETEG